MPWVIGTIMVASLVTLVLLQSTSLWKDFEISSSSDLLLLYALSGLNFAALIIFGFIFLRSIIKLARERRTFTLGARIKTRLLIYFFAVTLMPIIAMAFFSYLFMNRALDRWFTNIPETVLRETQELQRQSLLDRRAKLDETTRMLAKSFEITEPGSKELASIAAAGSLIYIGVFAADQSTLASFDREVSAEERVQLNRLIQMARGDTSAAATFRDGSGYDVGTSTFSGGRTIVVVPDPYAERTLSKVVENSVDEFEKLKEQQVTIRQVGLLTLGVLTFLLIFASTWIAFYVARGLTAPIKALAEGADEIARGNLGHRVDVFAEDELALLITTFNEMSAKLESNSIELSERRKYIETVLETLPTGIISFTQFGELSTINRAAVDILRLEGRDLSGGRLEDLVNAENKVTLERLLGRAKRVGQASDQAVFRDGQADGHVPSDNELTVALTATKLPLNGGVVLVIEDLSELIAAQRASAWQEVARRMAHEIKNPLTPIQLSAERIAKRFSSHDTPGNGDAKRIDDNAALGIIVSESTATILREVSSLKTMVDEFSRFARLPDTKFEFGNINDVISRTVAGFEGRFSRLLIELSLADNLPNISLDPEKLKRIFVNLIENAVEAFDDDAEQPLIRISTRYEAARDLVVAEVSDNGKGIEPRDLQKLFQPYFSTKGRGTGLGLAIVSRTIKEHGGRVKVVGNHPNGAKFILELPVNS